MILVRQPWTRQPHVGAQRAPQWSQIMGTSLVGISPFADDNTLAVNVGTVGTAPSPFGNALNFAAGTNMRRATIRGSTIGTVVGVGASLLGIIRTTSTATDGRMVALGSDQGGSGNTVFSIGNNAGSLRVTVGGSATIVTPEVAVSINDGQWHCVVLTLQAFTTTLQCIYSVFYDGRKVLGADAGVATGASNTYNWIVANGFRRGGTDSAGIACDVALAVPFHRALTDSEAASISTVRSAWSLFAPRQIIVPTAEAATGPTVLAVTPTTIGSTSHRPRYTWTPA
jgi:hypothetical protein